MTTSLATERLRLRRLVEADIEHLVALDADPEVMRYLSGGTPTPREYIEIDILPRMTRIDSEYPQAGYWAVTAHANEGFLGWVGLVVRSSSEPPEAELGYRLRRAVWSRGYATEASRALIDRLFRGSDVERVFATTYQDNLASQRVMQKLGMSLVRRYRMTRAELERTARFALGAEGPWDGDDLEYAIDRATWLRGPTEAASPRPGR